MKLFTATPRVVGHSEFTFAISDNSKMAEAIELYTGADEYQIFDGLEEGFIATVNGTHIFDIAPAPEQAEVSKLIVVEVQSVKYVAPVDAPNFGEASDYVNNILNTGLQVPTLEQLQALTNN